MNFYSAIAAHYDAIFPFNPKQLSFIKTHAPSSEHKRLIEVGSARGVLTHACAKEGYQVRGLELDETMVAMAQIQYSDIPFYASNMLDLKYLFSMHSCDVMVCFGNTLVHLSRTESMLRFLKAAFITLEEKGKLLIQFINYDRIIDQNINALPTISNEDITFVRDYELVSDTRLLFNASLTVHADKKTTQNTQALYPLRKSAFEDLAQEAGFKCKAFGGFDGRTWSEDAMQSIFVCTK